MTSHPPFSPQSPPTSCPAVLVADEDPRTRDVIGASLARIGWYCESIASHGELVPRLKEREFDVVVADLVLGGGEGLALLRRIRACRPDQAIVVVAEKGSLTDWVALMKEGVADVLQKPVDAETFARTVSRVVTSVRERERTQEYFKHAISERTEFCFTSNELADCRLPLPILERLEGAGLLELQSKLKLELAFQEALANALEHGNLELESAWKEELGSDGIDVFSLRKRERLHDSRFGGRPLWITIDYDTRSLKITIRDCGKGFSPQRRVISDPNAEVPHGRGLAIIYAAVDEVWYSEFGNEVTLIKRIPG